uniref:Proteasome subunit beta n=1 Tax=Strombidium inclinatum TaxID=197538 RepID=A0A7S3IKE6_9SPIT|mmetsp:Transcript_2208/g.3325  ORF Transcript_2208/g.3325 Transcript_2208/m.3325 type:complete len:196 (+) Transcript_2208:13-600(+)|eukprot:CAMPEP_0170494798 /NCGR_PEP_ID=MMETSP0208-20121228/14846_1 /TAXON_ID=197538 /ORGANISM="Strombidium inclinatum, Strain S3" /LENGTH=195 /DNA_ID=CAMNT_0010770899 /DNA_START=18 /DNA_END=605 /DNA_ORIENTATION=-
MDAVFGIAGKEWALIVTDTAVNRSIFSLVHDEDKITEINQYKILGCAGEQQDRYAFTNYIKRNLELQEMRTGCELGVEATAQYMRSELAKALRSGPYQVNVMIAGYDLHEQRAKLYWMDYLGTLQQVNKGAQGYASYFVSSILDNHFRADMTLDQGLSACKQCIKELRTRFTINQHSFQVKIVTRDGTKVMKDFE